MSSQMKGSGTRSPRVLPRISQHLLLTLFQVPRCISFDRSPSWRAKVMISPMTSSATLRELANGELKTAMPWRAAYSRSTWFVPMQKHPMTSRFLASRSTFSVSFVFERMPMTWTSLLLGQIPVAFRYLIKERWPNRPMKGRDKSGLIFQQNFGS